MSIVRRCPLKAVPYIEVPLQGFYIKPIRFSKSVRWKEVFPTEDVRYGEVSLYLRVC